MTFSNREKGNIGENIACKYLKKLGFLIQERNYRKPWGELDIVAVRDSIIHFFEVKSVSVSNLAAFADRRIQRNHSPEENVNSFKLKQIRKMVRTYFSEQGLNDETEFHFHVLCVDMQMEQHLARVRWIKDIIL